MKKLVAPLAVTLLSFSSAASAQVLITELQPNPNGPDPAEWFEIQNIGSNTVDISGWTFNEGSGAVWTFPMGTMMTGGQVIVVTVQYGTFNMRSMIEWGGYQPDFEMAIGNDNMMIPNVTGGGTFALNQGDDYLIIRDDMGNFVDGVEYGADVMEVPGAPVMFWPTQSNINEGLSIQRVADGNMSSAVDFTVTNMTGPGDPYMVGMGTPPMVLVPRRDPASFTWGADATLTATISDIDGVAGGSVGIAIATTVDGTADGMYVTVPMAQVQGNLFSATAMVNDFAMAAQFPEPIGFHERYIRWFYEGTDNGGASARLPAGATEAADNTEYYWENILPSNAVFSIAEAREQDVNEVPLWEGHSVVVEGIALTDERAFDQVNTNFYIADPVNLDAIRIFDNGVTMTDVNPGDVVRVTGKIGVFRGVRQVGRDERRNQPEARGEEIVIQVMGTDTIPLQTASIATLLAQGEAYESQLVQVPNCTMVAGPNGEPIPAMFESNTTVYISDAGGDRLPVRIFTTDLIGMAPPTDTFTFRGILSQFAPGGTGGYQLQPRGMVDVLPPMAIMDGGMNDAGGDNDSGVVDSGAGGNDAGTRDAGSGTGPDDAGTRDGGTRPTGGAGGDRDDGGCNCNAAHQRSPYAFAVGILLIGGLLFARRRRR